MNWMSAVNLFVAGMCFESFLMHLLMTNKVNLFAAVFCVLNVYLGTR